MVAIRGRTASNAYDAQGALDLGVFSPALEKVKLTVGCRYTWERMVTISYTVLSRIADIVSKSIYRNSDPGYTYDVDYQITANTLLYAYGREACKTGGITAQLPTTDPSYMCKPEKMVGSEADVKTLFSMTTCNCISWIRTICAPALQLPESITAHAFRLLN